MKTFLVLFIIFYLLPSLISFVGGLQAANYKYSGCAVKMTRIEYIYPAYRLGCYMNEEIK